MSNSENISKTIALNGRNWQAWRFQTTIVLRSKKLLGIVTGTEVRPAEAGKTQEIWDERENKAQEVIVTRVEETVMTYLISCSSSRQMWQKLCTLYEPATRVGLHLLQQRFFNIEYEDPIVVFITKVEECVNQLATAGEKISENMIITKIIMSLPDKYKHFASAWESISEEKQTLQELTGRLLVEEERSGNRAISSASSSGQQNSALVVGAQRSIKCFECGKIGHKKSECRNRKCNNCHKVGHLMKDCKLKKNKYIEKNTNTNSKTSFVTREMQGNLLNSKNFVLDSGASDHMCYIKEMFSDFCELSNRRFVTIGDGNNLEVLGIGKVDVYAYNDSEYTLCTLDDVLYVPQLNVNLFSLGSAINKGHKMVSDYNGCKFYKNGSVTGVADKYDKMYVMDFKFSDVALLTLTDWHGKMAHQNYQYVKEFLDLKGIKYEGQTDQCLPCIQGKQHRLPFHQSSSRSVEPGELIHMDLCGPMEEVSVGGSSYFLLLKDDYSSYRFVYFIKNKYETKEKIEEFIELFENEFRYKIKRFRSDNGTEFVNRVVENLFKTKGIVHELTVSYTPEQNGRIEREMRTVVESARTMIIQSGLGKELWAEAVNTAVFTINRTGKSKVSGKTPYELLYNKCFDVTLLREFGTKVCTHVPKQLRLKWDSKSKLGVFVGYGDYTKGYRVWDSNTRRVETCRDVVFIKNKEEVVKMNISPRILLTDEDVIEQEPPLDKDNKEQNQKDKQLELQEENKEIEIEECKEVEQQEDGIGSNVEDERSSEVDLMEEYLEEEFLDAEEERSEEKTISRNRRQVKKPVWTKDYEMALIAQGTEQLTYEEAVSGEHKEKWLKAIEVELEALNKNNTWKEVSLPEGKKLIDTKWVFKIKKEGNKDLYKARLVARGFKQEDKFDHSEIYAPVAKLPTLRILLAIASKYNMNIHQMDVKSAFLYGNIEEEVFVEKPKGMKKDGRVLKLQRSLYGLKKSPRYWNDKFNQFMVQEGFKRNQSDYCLYYKNDKKFYILLYVDDLILLCEDEQEIKIFKEALQEKFDMKDLGSNNLKYLGINITKKNDVIELDQEQYLDGLLKKYNMEGCKPIATPIEQGLVLEKEVTTDKELIKRCRQLIGSLMYAMLGTRPDLCYALSYLSRFQCCATESLWKALKRILRYIKGTIGLKLIYRKGVNVPLEGYTDADWAGDQGDRKSTSGYIMKVFGNIVSWSCNKQQCISLSSTESEYVALGKGIAEGCWIRNLLGEIGVDCKSFIIKIDNQSAIHVAKNPECHKRLKHIDIKYHFVRQKVENKIVCLEYVPSGDQLADICTKGLSKVTFAKLREMLFS